MLSAPWSDSEGLFRPGRDYLVARDQAEMTAHMRALADDGDPRVSFARSGLESILARHTCAHRAAELIAIASTLDAGLEVAR